MPYNMDPKKVHLWAIAEHLFAYRLSLGGLFHSISLNNTHAHKRACPTAINSKRNNLLILRLSLTCLILYRSSAFPMLIFCNSSFSCLMEDKLWISKPPLPPPPPLPPLHEFRVYRCLIVCRGREPGAGECQKFDLALWSWIPYIGVWFRVCQG